MIIRSDIDFEDYLEIQGTLEGQEIHWANRWKGQLLHVIKHGVEVFGDMLPWSKTHNHFRLRGGEFTVWAGINGHRKSMFVGQLLLWLAKSHRVCIASLEMKPETTLLRMTRQAAGCFPSADFASEFSDWCEDRICIYDQLDTVEAVRILGMVHYAAKELGCKHIVIDSLTKCGLREEDYAAEKKFIDRLQWAAKHYDIHLHLICHMRKGISEERVPNKFDIKGSGAITDLADNVVVLWKNKMREEAKRKQKLGHDLTQEETASLDHADQRMIVEKQRNGEWEGKFLFWFEDASLQFVPSENRGAMPFHFSKQEAA